MMADEVGQYVVLSRSLAACLVLLCQFAFFFFQFYTTQLVLLSSWGDELPQFNLCKITEPNNVKVSSHTL